MEISKAKNIHFIGIGGIGNSGLAQILHSQGKIVTGSDMSFSNTIASLRRSKIKVTISHSESNLPDKTDIVIYSPAIPQDNVELQKAKVLKIKCLTYPQALGELTKNHYTIAISGAHGKSTTTAMIAKILLNAKLDPSVIIGTKMKELHHRNFRMGKSKYLVIEACEYKRSFLNFYPKILVITNIEADHLDYYKDLKDYQSAFIDLAKKVPKDGFVVINADDKNSLAVIGKTKAKIITWSHQGKSADYQLKNDLLKNKKIEHSVRIHPKVPGKFNIRNGAVAATVCSLLNIPYKKIEHSLSGFSGTWRRMEIKRKHLGKTIFLDDYAHHPTEIKTTLQAIREKHPKAKILCIYQPHQYSRTRFFLKGFGESFKDVDKVIIPNIYKVRDSEEETKKMSADILVNEIRKHHRNVENGNGLKQTAQYIKKNYSKFDLIITMGAGDIDKIYKMF
ncbi:MAG: UDP-N-acetylmuramate--L-alanine ligase [Candidatus Gracilibacteria bacterium]|jgi:UDP-N-acetylmuramate--alanine ligase